MSIKVPAVIVCTLIAFGFGALAGVATMAGFAKEERNGFGLGPSDARPDYANTPMPGMPGGGGGGRGGAGGFGGGRGPSPKAQLATLIVKLDQLTQKPLTVQLTADEKQKIRQQLQDLPDKDEISDQDAKARLD